MMENLKFDDNNVEENDLKFIFLKHFQYWPYYVLSIFIFIALSFIYLRYADDVYFVSSKIEIIDKSQDSEMALPTAMTIFNRSMINLENEKGVLKSRKLHRTVVKKLNSNVKFYTEGKIKDKIEHPSEWVDNYFFDLKIPSDSITKFKRFNFNFNDGTGFSIDIFNQRGELLKTYSFKSLSTYGHENDLPFNIRFNETFISSNKKFIEFRPFESEVTKSQSSVKFNSIGTESDQISIDLEAVNKKLAIDYLETLMISFNEDGIVDRQSEYKRTIEFVDERAEILRKELDIIEERLRDFKTSNQLTNIEADAQINVEQKLSYNAELFNAKSQKDLVKILSSSISENEFKLMPINIGVENESLNNLIYEYNLLVNERDRYITSSGSRNYLIVNLEKKLRDYKKNIKNSISNYSENLDLTILNLENKESEFAKFSNDIPENEKILRSINRELEIKESLFLLLLQKREEASINFAVVKPSIKIIDNAVSSVLPISPNKPLIVFLSSTIGLLLVFLILSLIFFFDNKLHTKQQLSKYFPNTPILGEIPFIKSDNDKLLDGNASQNRSILQEAVRMISANLNFTNLSKIKNGKIILVTSSVKGEGKTIMSTNLAKVLSLKSNNKVLLLGADLRNPQIHKYLNINKDINGISNYIYQDIEIDSILNQGEYFDYILSGAIPPNPTELLSSQKLAILLEKLKLKYDYLVIDSAPCLLVSDTFEISNLADTSVYLTRSNHTRLEILDFINEIIKQNKLPNLNLVINGIGDSKSYGYKYLYKYGYGYNYDYNYGYGYDYKSDD